MAQTPEGKVKDKIKAILKRRNVYYAMPIGTGYGNSGVPDFLVCANGVFIGVEAKAGKNKPTALQEEHMRRIRSAGGVAMVVNEDNINELRKVITWNSNKT